MNYEKLHSKYKNSSIQGRYLNLNSIESFSEFWKTKNKLEILGLSVQARPIYKFQIGSGTTKILMWSQMHGNESTTTKGLVDFMNVLQSNSEIAKAILKEYTFCIIPMLNPDGAFSYKRVNANEVDLNRDFQNLSQPESQILMQCYSDFQPDYCYNLHDQRTIFGVGKTGKPATISFLAPSFSETKEYDEARLKSVDCIMRIVRVLDTFLPGQIGRFDDGFNINCVGDTFQSLKTPTILIEAGHFQNDYDREVTRKFVFIALLSAFLSPLENVVVNTNLSDYLNIPQNNPNFYDFVFKNIVIRYDKSNLITNFAIQFREELINNKVIFNAFIAKVGNLDSYFGHTEIDGSGIMYSDEKSNIPLQDELANFKLGDFVNFVNGILK